MGDLRLFDKEPSPTPGLGIPQNLRVANGPNSGQLANSINTLQFSTGYLFQYATDEMLAAENWQSIATTRSKCIIGDLQPGVKYHCRVAAMGTKNQIMYSDIINRIVA